MRANVRGKQLTCWIGVLIKSVQSTPVHHEQTVPGSGPHMTAQDVSMIKHTAYGIPSNFLQALLPVAVWQ